jgi:NADH dehydrogenase FAD-containing subunit
MQGEAKRQIVVVGGGFAGAGLIKHLQSRLPTYHELVWVSEESYTTFNPMLAEAVGHQSSRNMWWPPCGKFCICIRGTGLSWGG